MTYTALNVKVICWDGDGKAEEESGADTSPVQIQYGVPGVAMRSQPLRLLHGDG